MKLQPNLFDLSESDINMSKMMYNDKIVKCLIAPYHNQRNIEMEYAENIFMFPEKEMSQNQTRNFISMIANSKFKEVLIITAEVNIIYDMIDCCVRILTEFDTIIPSPEKTFAANQHTIIHDILNNKSHQKTEQQKTKTHSDINRIIERINSRKPITKEEYDSMLIIINTIGEEIISGQLKKMLNTKFQG